MSDKTRAFKPWENAFSEGLYLAGIEVADQAAPPVGWTKWTSPAYEYATTPMTVPNSFFKALARLEAEGLSMVGAAYDRIDPQTGETLIYFPIRRAIV